MALPLWIFQAWVFRTTPVHLTSSRSQPAHPCSQLANSSSLYADKAGGAGIHLGFSLKTSGDDLYLHDRPASGGALLDSVVFGVQVPDLSLGRAVDGTWQLCTPTFGADNQVLELADPRDLRINEWLADELFLANNDFVEVYNPGSLPAALGGCFLSNAEGAPALNPIPDLSFIAAGGFVSFVADGDTSQGADHVAFQAQSQRRDYHSLRSRPAAHRHHQLRPTSHRRSQGRSPSGSNTIVAFAQPTAGGPNPVTNGGGTRSPM